MPIALLRVVSYSLFTFMVVLMTFLVVRLLGFTLMTGWLRLMMCVILFTRMMGWLRMMVCIFG